MRSARTLHSAPIPRGRFVWYELLARDAAGALEFYPRVFGWGVEVYTKLEDPYPMFTVEGRPMGGVLQVPRDAVGAGEPSGWLGYVTTPNVDATVDRAVALGSTLLADPRDIGDIGRMAVLADPQGARIAFYTPRRPPETDPEPGPGEVAWRELVTGSHHAAVGFYAELFGWSTLEEHDLGELGTYRVFGDAARSRGGMFDAPDGVSSSWIYYVRVVDIEGILARVEAHRGSVVDGPMEVPGGDRVARARDPQGALFALRETNA